MSLSPLLMAKIPRRSELSRRNSELCRNDKTDILHKLAYQNIGDCQNSAVGARRILIRPCRAQNSVVRASHSRHLAHQVKDFLSKDIEIWTRIHTDSH